MRQIWIYLVLVLIPMVSFGQDGLQVLTEEDLLWFVEEFHPVSRQGELILSGGESVVREARGRFDPELMGSFDQKNYEDKNYYSLLGTGLKIPTWFGMELKAGYQQNSGDFLNPQNSLPDEGQWYAGVRVPLLKGLLIDKRRAVLKQAKLFAGATRAEQQKLLNDLFFEAIKQYWLWVEAWNNQQVYREAIAIAQTRFEAVVRSYELGDKPAIDTLEAFIQVQNLGVLQNEQILRYQNASLELSNYLWIDDNTPVVITDRLRPPQLEALGTQVIAADSLQRILTRLPDRHPDIQLYDFKGAKLEIDRRLKAESFKPKVNVNYNFLSQANLSEPSFSTQNYKWGAEFSFPLLLRSERGKVQLAKLKIQDNQFEQQQKLQQIRNQVRSYFNKQEVLSSQVSNYQEVVGNYDLMLRAERRKFDIGESSLFLVNSRQKSLIDAQLKLINMISKMRTSRAGVLYAAGELYEGNISEGNEFQ